MAKRLQISPEEAQKLRESFRATQDKQPIDWEHWWRCWSKQACGDCLNTKQCSWCPYTWACVPNKYDVPLLAPAYEEQICPHPDERWELRTTPFGCRVSTFTSFSIVIAALSTILVGLITLLAVTFIRRCVRWQRRRAERRKQALAQTEGTANGNREREPLLAQPPSAVESSGNGVS